MYELVLRDSPRAASYLVAMLTMRAFQNYQGVLCNRCNEGYYPLIGLCLKCPEVGFTLKNFGNCVAVYGGICVLWLLLNRVIAEELTFLDSICNFCQITGTLGGFSLVWPCTTSLLTCRFPHLAWNAATDRAYALCTP